jgi:CBS domain-containing protein
MKGIRKYYVEPGTSAKEVLEKMQELHIDSIPVVDENKRWLFFANRGEILANLMTSILLSKEE